MPENIIADLRSDTVTKATPAMRQAMADAEVGDEGREGDPTAKLLERRASELTGHEAALFCSSGTMGNLIAFCCHLRPGEEVIAERDSHFLHYESGGISAIAGAITRPLPGVNGRLELDSLHIEIEQGSRHKPKTSLLVAENTHNLAGGACLDITYMKGFREVADAYNLPIHLDGARIWNAAVALGAPVKSLTSECDSVMVDLSKGLGAPYGSLLCGRAEFIERARFYRQRIGGGVRQIGHMAAAGLIALETMIERLAEDHANARYLAEAIHATCPACVDLELVQTNMVIVKTESLKISGNELAARLCDAGVLCLPFGPSRVRLMTHYDVNKAMIETAGEVITSLLKALI